MGSPSGGIPEDLFREVQDLLRKGSKIEAVKRVRERTGWGLKDAKNAVDAVEAGRQPGGAWADAEAGGAESSEPSDDVEREVRDLLVAGRKIDAIKRVRERDGCGLKEAKDKIEAVIARYPHAFPKLKGAGCGTTALSVVIVAFFLICCVAIFAYIWKTERIFYIELCVTGSIYQVCHSRLDCATPSQDDPLRWRNRVVTARMVKEGLQGPTCVDSRGVSYETLSCPRCFDRR